MDHDGGGHRQGPRGPEPPPSQIPPLEAPGLLRKAAPLLFQGRPIPTGRMSDSKRILVYQSVPGRGCPAAPFQVLGQSRSKPTDRVENGTVCQEIRGDGKSLPLHVSTIVESEDGLEGFRARPGLGALVEDGHRTADEISVTGHCPGPFEPVVGGYAITIEKHQNRRRRFCHATVACDRGTLRGFNYETHPFRQVWGIRRCVIDDDDLVRMADLW